jgi:hypothetical protein
MTKVAVPEWGGKGDDVYVRTLCGHDVDAVQAMAKEVRAKSASDGDIGENPAVMAAWVILTVCDSESTPLFTNADTGALLDGPMAPLRRCMEEALDLNGITDEATEEGNLKGSPGGDSPTG